MNQVTPASLSGAPPPPAPEAPKNSLDGEGFLTLLMAQLTNQDPTSPVETTEFMQQLTSLNTVQQLVAANKSLEGLMTGITSLNNEGAVNLVGKEVTAVSSGFTKVNGEPETLEFDLPADAKSVEITIFDADGIPIDTINPGDQVAGPRTVTWNSDDPDGDYTFKVKAIAEDDSEMAVTTYTTGLVDEIRFDAGFPVLVIDGRHVALADVITVRPGPVPVVPNLPTSEDTSSQTPDTGLESTLAAAFQE